MTALAELIREKVAADGPLPVSEFIALALGHPEFGYYRTRDPFGRAGDFITAPEISQVFGEVIGAWCAVMWDRAGRPDTVQLVELGPGRGTLMADMLRAIGSLPEMTKALSVHLIETSAVLRQHQQEKLEERNIAVPVSWHDTIGDVPDEPMIVIANEFFDALPIEQYVKGDDGWRRRCVAVDAAGGLSFTKGKKAAPETIPEIISHTTPQGSIYETCPAAVAVIEHISDRLAADGIAALIIDYGHARPGAGDTLQAVRDHKYAPVLDAPGEADLTAHVDFSALAQAAQKKNAVSFGPAFQGDFLNRLGLPQRTAQLASGTANPAQAAALQSGCERLIDADAMGTLFKALAICREESDPPPGFETGTPA